MRLEGKVAFIAGAGGRQGTAVPLLFAQEGAAVVLAARREAEITEIAERIRSDGGRAEAMAGDLTDSGQVQSAVQEALDSLGRVDILYNNLGAYQAGSLHETSEEDWNRTIAVNLTAHALTARSVIPAMIEQGSGSIVNVSAARAARLGGNAAYAASKGGVIAMTHNLARAYHGNNIRVNCICPTNIGDAADRWLVPLPEVSLRRGGRPEDVAHLALFLASDESAWITGGVFVVDGGAEVMA
jgi:NAD(P)-dependent dehydrogenase (short-subunit alcohol dehydrogenase family)